MENNGYVSQSERVIGGELTPLDTNQNNQNKDGPSFSSPSSPFNTSACTNLPAPSPTALRLELRHNNRSPSSSTLEQTPKTPLRRTPSSASIGRSERSKTPTLHKRASMSSLQGGTPPRPPAFRRTSSNLASPSPGVGPRAPLPAPVEEPTPVPVTSVTVAHDFFQQELEAHHSSESTLDHKTVVILQDNCYGHRFSRPRTSKAGLATIVERPERIRACILGLATAYVRLGGRHKDGAMPPLPKRDMKKLSSIPFRIHKTNRTLPLTSPAAIAIHGLKWMSELSTMCDSAETKLALNGKELVRPGVPALLNGSCTKEQPKLHEGDLYLCSGSLSALEGALGGVCEGVDAVFVEKGPKRAFVCIRPPGHHCSADYPSGFCWLNNVHVGIGHAALNHGLTHAAIIDFDLHHGDGSQSIAWDHNSRAAKLPKNAPQSKKTAIGYFSLHDINSYPCEMGDEEKVQNASLCLENAHGQTVWNIHLQPWKTEAQFWELYEDRYMILLSKARAFLRSHTERLRSASNHPHPKAAIFLSAGFDASEWESAGMQRHQVNVPTDFYARFTRDVVRLAEEKGLGVDGRVISVLEGGYSDRALLSGVLSHLSGLTASENLKDVDGNHSLGNEMGRRLGKLDLNGDRSQESVLFETFDSRWWALPRLEEVESLLSPPTPVAAPKKSRNPSQPTYTSITQSYSAKIVSSPHGRRSFSTSGSTIYPSQSRPPSPPPPAVELTTAVHELAKLLIPSDRETRSCKPEELNAEASRARRDRQSVIDVPAEVPASENNRRQLRDRRNKLPKYAQESDEEKSVSRTIRRKTIAEVPLLDQGFANVPAILPPNGAVRSISRRLSVSSVGSDRPSEVSLSSSVTPTPQQGPLVVKKTRLPSNPPTEAAKARAIKKQPVVSRAPSRNSVAQKPSVASTSTHGISRPAQLPLSSNDELRNKDLDELTSGLKKMAIKMKPPPKQEQASSEAKPKPAPRGRPKSTVPRMKKIPEARKTIEVNRDIKLETKGENGVILEVLEISPQSADLAASSPVSAIPFDKNTPKSPSVTASLPAAIAQNAIMPQEPPADEIQSGQSLASLDGPPIPSFLAPNTLTIPAYDAPNGLEPATHHHAGTLPKEPLTSFTTMPSNSTIPNQPPLTAATFTTLQDTFFRRPTSSSSAISSNSLSANSPSSSKSTPSKQNRHDLPIFNPTSPIIFGKPSTLAPSIGSAIRKFEDAAVSNMNVVASGSSPSSSGTGKHGDGEVAGGNITTARPSSSGITEMSVSALEEEDMWAVPPTPQLIQSGSKG